MNNDWINLKGTVLPSGEVIPDMYLTVNSHVGVEAVIHGAGGVLTVVDLGSLAGDSDIAVMGASPEIYSMKSGTYTGEISVSEYPGTRFIYSDNALIGIK